jgi:predicted metalloprotease with PDZ domain
MSADLYVLNLRNAGAPDNHPKLVEAQKHLREQIISQKTLQKYREELRDLNREASENSENSRSFLTPKRYGGIGIRSDDEFVGGICTATITDVFEDSPAKFAGLKPGDQLIIPAKTYKESIEKIRDEGIKKSGSIQVRRNGKVIDIEIKTAIMNYDRSRRTGALDNFGYSRQMDEKVRGG